MKPEKNANRKAIEKAIVNELLAAPNTTEASSANDAKYDCIFNIVNSHDFIPYFPLSQWGFRRYGKTASVSVEDTCKAEWEEMVGESYMRMADPTAPLAELAEVAGSRNGCYAEHYGLIMLDSYPNVCDPYYRVGNSHIDIMGDIATIKYDVYQCPMFLMKYFAAVAAGEVSGGDFALLNLVPPLNKIKLSLLNQIVIQNGLALNQVKIAHPHLPESYYLLTQNCSM